MPSNRYDRSKDTNGNYEAGCDLSNLEEVEAMKAVTKLPLQGWRQPRYTKVEEYEELYSNPDVDAD